MAVAVAVADSCSSDLIPSLGTSICHECGPKKRKKKRKEKKKIYAHYYMYVYLNSLKGKVLGVPIVAQWKGTQLVSMRTWV